MQSHQMYSVSSLGRPLGGFLLLFTLIAVKRDLYHTVWSFFVRADFGELSFISIIVNDLRMNYLSSKYV